MLVLIANDIFSNAENEIALLALLHAALSKRCYLDAYHPNSIEFLAWYQRLGKSHQQAWDDVASWSVRDRGLYRLRSWLVSDSPAAPSPLPTFPLQETIDRVNRAMRIWTENDRNDRVFWLRASNKTEFGALGGDGETAPS